MTQIPSPLAANENYIAALDIGSNSFHFVLARQLEQHLQIVHSEKYQVRLASGLDSQHRLSQQAIDRGVAILAKLATATQDLSPKKFRVVATYTLRKAKNAEAFLKQAADIFPYPIEIISGHEEARLIYQGVSFYQASNIQRLVIDIGGGSTECIIGIETKIKVLESLNMGCVSFQQQFFKNGQISKAAFNRAIKATIHEADAVVPRFNKHQWQSAIGTSGTIKTLYKLINEGEAIEQPLTLKHLYQIKERLISCKHVNQIDIESLKESRKEVICAGVAILIGLMESFAIKTLDFCQYALREGALYELLEDFSTLDVRQRTIESLQSRFNIDISQATQVKLLALHWLAQIESTQALGSPIYQELLSAAANLHELGFDINPSAYHKHGHYILTHADLAGFNQEQQYILAWLVLNQRKKITPLPLSHCYQLKAEPVNLLCTLLRLAVLLSQQRQIDDISIAQLSLAGNTIRLKISSDWLKHRPIVQTELLYEKAAIKRLGYQLTLLTD
ncbi:Ppx/GppA phosphatase family protein [Thalassotalea ganghwensis]